MSGSTASEIGPIEALNHFGEEPTEFRQRSAIVTYIRSLWKSPCGFHSLAVLLTASEAFLKPDEAFVVTKPGQEGVRTPLPGRGVASEGPVMEYAASPEADNL
jgi:hypothetical protein